MAKILNVDFKRKHLEYTWDETSERKRIVETIHEDMQEIMIKVVQIEPYDEEYQREVARLFTSVIFSLRDRTK